MLDLHFHSTTSDGRKTPTEILEHAKTGDTLTCTDHDIVNDEFVALAREKGIQTCESVEISAYDSETPDLLQLHVTYYAKTINHILRSELEAMRQAKVRKIQLSLEVLEKNGLFFDREDFLPHFYNLGFKIDNLNNSHIADYIFANPLNEVILEKLTGEKLHRDTFLYECLKQSGKFAWVGVSSIDLRHECNMDVSRIIEHTQHDGGIASLAHPQFNLKTIDRYRTLVRKYLQRGLQSVEINTYAPQEWIDEILASQKNLGHGLTFGSDCHFTDSWGDEKHFELGEMNALLTPEFILQETKKTLGNILS